MRRTLARAVFYAAGLVARIKTPQRMYRMTSTDPLVLEPTQRRWTSCKASVWLFQASMRIDPGLLFRQAI